MFVYIQDEFCLYYYFLCFRIRSSGVINHTEGDRGSIFKLNTKRLNKIKRIYLDGWHCIRNLPTVICMKTFQIHMVKTDKDISGHAISFPSFIFPHTEDVLKFTRKYHLVSSKSVNGTSCVQTTIINKENSKLWTRKLEEHYSNSMKIMEKVWKDERNGSMPKERTRKYVL